MHALLRPLFAFFLHIGGFGLVIPGALDSSFFFLPFGNDLLLVVLVARHHGYLPLYVLAASLGWGGRRQEDGERQPHQLPEEEDEPECGRPSDRCLPGAAAVSIHRGHRRRERIPVPEDATAGLCPRHPRRSVHSHRACSNHLRAPDSPHCELAAIYLVHRGVFHAVHRWKRVVDSALGSAEPLPIGGEYRRIPRFSLNNQAWALGSRSTHAFLVGELL